MDKDGGCTIYHNPANLNQSRNLGNNNSFTLANLDVFSVLKVSVRGIVVYAHKGLW